MAVPRNRLSNARKNSKRSHHAKRPRNISACSNCQTPRLSHRICPHCGFYSGRVIIHAKAE
ncbi:MAG TPA: 50S ribosomal protein L32 [Parachlamydiales bacterium]|nr:50S ribosomal protein L32 [Parachlamydiales bacterium]HCJ84159.1 50S ribosomal protein L32 [Parachlamydiales bacterium]